jgi:phosphate starvation-inducible PhoH-like protein
LINDKILVHGVGGKIIKAMTPNQQLLVDTINKKRYGFAVGPAGTENLYRVAMAVKALKEKTSKTHYPYPSSCGSRGKPRISSGDERKLDPYMQPLYDALRDMLPNESWKIIF